MAPSTSGTPQASDLGRFYEHRDLATDDPLPDSHHDVGARIAEARGQLGLTRDELGEHVGVRGATVRRWEEGRSRPRANRLATLAGVLGVSFSWLVMGRGESPVEPEGIDSLRHDIGELRQTLSEAVHSLDRIEARLAVLDP